MRTAMRTRRSVGPVCAPQKRNLTLRTQRISLEGMVVRIRVLSLKKGRKQVVLLVVALLLLTLGMLTCSG